jgi:phosphoglycolate phosphatase
MTIIFDYDGTIHNTMYIYEPAFRETYGWMVEQGWTKKEEISSEKIGGWLGMNSREMWEDFLPSLSRERKEEASKKVGEKMEEMIRKHQAVWYEGALEVLGQLKEKGHDLIILSNCKTSYKKAHWKEFGMDRWFKDFYDCETYGFAPKTEIIHEIRMKYRDSFLVIGDRKSDLDCAKAGNSPFIGCLYGFGSRKELEGADFLVSTIGEIPSAVEAVCV